MTFKQTVFFSLYYTRFYTRFNSRNRTPRKYYGIRVKKLVEYFNNFFKLGRLFLPPSTFKWIRNESIENTIIR